MQSLDVYFQKISPPGSAFYYAIKKYLPEQRHVFLSIQSFYQELEEVIFHFSDVGIAQARLNWWRTEVIKISQSEPDHPISLALKKHRVDPEKLLLLIDGFEQLLNPIFNSFEDVVVQWIRTVGLKELLFFEVEHANQEPDKENIYQAMLVIELVSYLQHLRHYVRHDLLYFPQDELQNFQVTKQDLQGYKTNPNINSLLTYQMEKIQRALSLIKKDSLPKQLQIRLQISCALLKEIAGSYYQVLENFIDITPLKRWWISLRF